MLTERTDLKKQLAKLRELSEPALMEEVNRILQHAEAPGENLHERIMQDHSDLDEGNHFDIDHLSAADVFHLDDIKKVCITYRLRFLPLHRFKGKLPEEALSAVRNLESLHRTKLKGFAIVAPAEYFRLEDADDPLLFAPIGNGYYYLVHKWGKDMHPLRRLMVWPLKNIENLILFCLGISFLMTFGVQQVFFSRFQETSQFLILFLYTFKSVVALVFFYGISLGKNFSSGNWNSRFFNG